MSRAQIKAPADIGAFTKATGGKRAHIAHTFNAGQICPELNKPRSGVVHYECRSETAHAGAGSSIAVVADIAE